MNYEQAVIDKIEGVIGIEKEFAEPIVIEKGGIRKFVEATKDSNPLYVDENFAHDLGFSGVIAPPISICGHAHARFFLRDLPANLNGLHAGDEWEFQQVIHAGDRIQRYGKVIEVKKKTGSSGKMVFVTLELRFVNQKGVLVSLYRPTFMIRLNRLEEEDHAALL